MRRLLALWVLGLGALAQVPVGQVATRDVHALLWLPDGRLLFGHHDGIHVSEDEGRTWQDLVRQMGFDAMGLVWRGTVSSPPGTGACGEPRRGQGLAEPAPPGASRHGPSRLCGRGRAPRGPRGTHGYFVSEDGGQIFKPTAPKGLPKANMAAMVFQGRTLYVAPMGQGLYQSPDGGQTFTQVPTPEKEIYALAVGVGTFTWEADRPLAEDPGGLEKAVAGHGPGPRRPSPGGRKLVFIDGQGRVWKLP